VVTDWLGSFFNNVQEEDPMSDYTYTMGKDVDLKEEQKKTQATPVMRANFILRMMYISMDIIYGPKQTLPKFKVIELLARYPYWAWEHGGYGLVTRLFSTTRAVSASGAAQALRHIDMGRESQDNEQWHLMLIEDLMRQQGIRQGWFRGVLLPKIMVLNYLFMTEIIYRVRKQWSFSMNARFESHAEHEYMKLVDLHPEWEDMPIETAVFEHYPRQTSVANLFRRIGLDERDHMTASCEEYERLTGKPLV
jgi:ubiquinol oxidase